MRVELRGLRTRSTSPHALWRGYSPLRRHSRPTLPPKLVFELGSHPDTLRTVRPGARLSRTGYARTATTPRPRSTGRVLSRLFGPFRRFDFSRSTGKSLRCWRAWCFQSGRSVRLGLVAAQTAKRTKPECRPVSLRTLNRGLPTDDPCGTPTGVEGLLTGRVRARTDCTNATDATSASRTPPTLRAGFAR